LRNKRLAAVLAERYRDSDGLELLGATLAHEFPGRTAVVSSIGSEAAVILDMVAQIDPATPVIFLETGRHFAETLAYRDTLVARLGLTDLRSVTPDPEVLAGVDPQGDLWRRDPDRCCRLRKVVPLARALAGFDAWVTGRKRYHGDVRSDLPAIEAAEGRIKINPLAGWSRERVQAWLDRRGLPRHPLVEHGYLSIGCAPCTAAVPEEASVRTGRWPGSDKSECGIHSALRVGHSRASASAPTTRSTSPSAIAGNSGSDSARS
jgi:phosphoadenosine phosphosulfate reductase